MIVAAAALVGAVAWRYPADGGLPFQPLLLLAFDATKLAAFLRAPAVLLLLNLAAWAAGGAAYRLLGGPAGRRPGLDALRRLALGLFALATLVLLLAALHLLHRELIVGLLAALAMIGLVPLAQALRDGALGARLRWLLAERAVQVALAALVLTGAVALCAAFMPDYGWDAFTYHLALPERYLFENRVVIAPLFPHTAFPLTVEMLYAALLAADPGPATKLLHAELGLLALAAVGAMAGRHARRAAGLSALVLLADPLLHWELGVSYSDLGATLFAVLALASLQEFLEDGSARAFRLCAVLCGACVATRYTAGLVAVAALAALWTTAGAWPGKLRHTLVLAGLALLMLSPWLIRNAAITGNPVAPLLQGLFYAPGQEFFDPLALRQQIAFAHGVGFGHGPLELLLLPVNLTARASLSDYRGFGFRVGPLAVAGVAAALALPAARRSPALRGMMVALAVLVLGWFVSAQEPRYLLPAIALSAVVAGVGAHEVLELGRATGAAALLVGALALGHTLLAAAVRLPFVYGYALGRLSVADFEGQEPALGVADTLRRTLGPTDTLLLAYEPRGFFFRGLRYVPAETRDLMQLVHRAGGPDALAVQLRELGVTHVLVNRNNIERYGTTAVPGYGEAESAQDLQTLGSMLALHSTPLLAERGVIVRRMEWAEGR